MPHRPPVHPGRFHHHLRDPHLAQPVPKRTRSAVNVENSRTTSDRPPTPSGWRTAAITAFLCTSRPAHRSTITSTTTPSHHGMNASPMEVARTEILRLVLEATIKGACRPPRQSDLRAHDTTELYDVSGRHPQVSSPTGDPARGHERLTCGFTPSACCCDPSPELRDPPESSRDDAASRSRSASRPSRPATDPRWHEEGAD